MSREFRSKKKNKFDDTKVFDSEDFRSQMEKLRKEFDIKNVDYLDFELDDIQYRREDIEDIQYRRDDINSVQYYNEDDERLSELWLEAVNGLQEMVRNDGTSQQASDEVGKKRVHKRFSKRVNSLPKCCVGCKNRPSDGNVGACNCILPNLEMSATVWNEI